jgi:DNA-binding MarR family transcriptional regulator
MNRRPPLDPEIAILQNIRQHDESHVIRQRDLSHTVGISLGMTNVTIRKLAQKGWLTVRKINNRNIKYAVSPAGVEAIARRGFSFLKRTVKEVAHYKDLIDSFLEGIKKNGVLGIELIGTSDFDFILVHLCQKKNLMFKQLLTPSGTSGTFVLFSENMPQGKPVPGLPAGTCASLRKILLAL